MPRTYGRTMMSEALELEHTHACFSKTPNVQAKSKTTMSSSSTPCPGASSPSYSKSHQGILQHKRQFSPWENYCQFFNWTLFFPATIITLRHLPAIHTSLCRGWDPPHMSISGQVPCSPVLAPFLRSQNDSGDRKETKESTQLNLILCWETWCR